MNAFVTEASMGSAAQLRRSLASPMTARRVIWSSNRERVAVRVDPAVYLTSTGTLHGQWVSPLFRSGERVTPCRWAKRSAVRTIFLGATL